ncbi:MAG: LysE family transporter [Deltaproteobacteria bacterium]|nr:LysE family transporter [Deltaproteobacteria bacterium]
MNFADPAAIFVSSFIIGLSGAMMPGPLLVCTVRDTTRRGFVAAPLLVLGHGILELALVALLLLGIAEWLKGDIATIVIALAGCAALFRMAYGMAREVRTLRFDISGGTETEPAYGGAQAWWRPVADGILASISNPYWSLWWVTIGLGYLAVSSVHGISGVVFFFTGHILSDAAWFMFVGSAVSVGRGRFTDRIYRGIVGVCAGFLFFFAVSFGYFGMSKLLRML